MFIRIILITTALVISAPAYAQTIPAAPSPATSLMRVTDPVEFGAMASVSNLFELESSTLALETSNSEDVKAFAQQMITDHTKAAQDMAPAAAEEGITPETALDDRHQDMLDALAALEGEEFDTAYIAAQALAHDEAVTLFEAYSLNGEAGALKDFAVATLPTLKSHQDHAHGLAGH